MEEHQQRKTTWTEDEVAALGLHTDVATAASILGRSRSHGYRLAKAGKFPVPVVKIGDRYLVPVRPLLRLFRGGRRSERGVVTKPVKTNLATIFAIRDARGLTADEKNALFIIESRGVLFTSSKRTAEDMGVSLSTYRKVITSLRAQGLVAAELQFGRDGRSEPTRYCVNREAVAALQPGGQLSQMDAGSSAVGGEGEPSVGIPAQGVGEEGVTRPHPYREAIDKEDIEDSQDQDNLQEIQPEESQEEDNLEDGHPGQRQEHLIGDSADTEPLVPVTDLISRAATMSEADIRLVVSVAIRNRKETPGLELRVEGDGVTYSFQDIRSVPKPNFVAVLSVRRGLLRELLRALPADELTMAFNIGQEAYSELRQQQSRVSG